MTSPAQPTLGTKVSWWRSPVLGREMRRRMLSPRAAVAITVWLGLLTALFVLAYVGENQSSDFGFQFTNVASIGRSVFEWLLAGMLLVVLFLVPATTSGSIAGERERQTLLPLQVSMMSPLSIVLGKMAAAIVFTALLVVLTTPLLALTYLIGGITILDIAKGVGMVLLTATMVGAVGVACSAVARRVQVATVLAYGFVLMISVGSLIAFGALAVLDDSRGFDEVNPPKEVLMLNPFMATGDIFDSIGQFPGDDTNTPLGAARLGLDGTDRVGAFQARPNTESTRLWRWYIVASLTIIYLSIGVATVKVRTPARSER